MRILPAALAVILGAPATLHAAPLSLAVKDYSTNSGVAALYAIDTLSHRQLSSPKYSALWEPSTMAQFSTSGQPNRAVRLTFTYGLSVSRQTLDQRAPPSDPIPDAQTKELQSGFWFEVHNQAGQTIYRRIVQNPMVNAVEVHDDGSHSAEPSRWQPINETQRTFSVVVPYVEPGTSVHLFSSPLGPRMSQEPAREIASFPIAEDGSGSGELR